MDIKIEELKESWAKMEEKYKELKADMPANPNSDQMNKIMDYIWNCMNSLSNQMWNLHDSHAKRMDNHMNPMGATHAPHLKTASQVQSYLKACNMNQDYNVEKPSIYVRASRAGNKEFMVDLNVPEKE